jgi:hypothetical protein
MAKKELSLEVTCQQVVVFNSNELGVYDGLNNIGLGVDTSCLLTVDPVSDTEVKLFLNVPENWEQPVELSENCTVLTW